MMIIIPLLMLTVPGMIAMRVRRSKEELLAENRIFLVCEYMIYSLVIIFVSYLFMFLTYPPRTVSFSLTQTNVASSIYSASFVVKYSFISILASVLLPHATDTVLTHVAAIPTYIEHIKNIGLAHVNRIHEKKNDDKPIK